MNLGVLRCEKTISVALVMVARRTPWIRLVPIWYDEKGKMTEENVVEKPADISCNVTGNRMMGWVREASIHVALEARKPWWRSKAWNRGVCVESKVMIVLMNPQHTRTFLSLSLSQSKNHTIVSIVFRNHNITILSVEMWVSRWRSPKQNTSFTHDMMKQTIPTIMVWAIRSFAFANVSTIRV